MGMRAAAKVRRAPVLLAVIGFLLCAACSGGGSDEERALRLAKESHAVGGTETVERFLESWMDENREDVRPVGWTVERKSGGTYLAKYRYEMYSFERGTGERAWVFEVDVNNGDVQDVTGRFQKKESALSPAFENVDQVREGVVQQLIREDALLSGRDQALGME